jgi:hypothetical protein
MQVAVEAVVGNARQQTLCPLGVMVGEILNEEHQVARVVQLQEVLAA